MWFKAFVALVSLAFSSHIIAGSTNVVLGELFCSPKKHICAKGSIDFDYSKGVMKLHGRVKKTTRPGRLSISLKGYSRRKNESFYAHIEAELKGKYSELFHVKSREYYSLKNRRDIKWEVDSVSYH